MPCWLWLFCKYRLPVESKDLMSNEIVKESNCGEFSMSTLTIVFFCLLYYIVVRKSSKNMETLLKLWIKPYLASHLPMVQNIVAYSSLKNIFLMHMPCANHTLMDITQNVVICNALPLKKTGLTNNYP